MSSLKDDAEREYQREHCCEDETCLDNYSTAELVSELRKRDGVDAYDVPTGGCYDLDIYSTQLRRIRDILHSELDIHGRAIILRITD